MANVEYTIREGQTEPVSVTLTKNGAGAVLTGYTSVALFLRSADGEETVTLSTANDPADLVVSDGASGVVQLLFEETDLKYSKRRYLGYFLVVDGAGERDSFPSDGWVVVDVLERLTADA